MSDDGRRDSGPAERGAGGTGREDVGATRRIRASGDLESLDFAKGDGLVPVVVQDVGSRDVLMVAWADREALEATLRTGEMHFHSRSRDALWRKGETSGNVQRLHSLHADCDADTVLALVEPAGPACHTGDRTCFGVRGVGARSDAGLDVLTDLWTVLEDRLRERSRDSYTVRLLDDENLRLKKLGEETAELIVALSRDDAERVPEEAADLLYHLLVALLGAGSSLDAVMAELDARRD